MTNVNDIIWTKELVRCTPSSFWKKTIRTLASLGIDEKNKKTVLLIFDKNNKNTHAVCVGPSVQKL